MEVLQFALMKGAYKIAVLVCPASFYTSKNVFNDFSKYELFVHFSKYESKDFLGIGFFCLVGSLIQYLAYNLIVFSEGEGGVKVRLASFQKINLGNEIYRLSQHKFIVYAQCRVVHALN